MKKKLELCCHYCDHKFARIDVKLRDGFKACCPVCKDLRLKDIKYIDTYPKDYFPPKKEEPEYLDSYDNSGYY